MTTQFPSIELPPYRAHLEPLEQNRVLRITMEENNRSLTHEEVINYWISSEPFRTFFCQIFEESGMDWYVWEMPPLTLNRMLKPFECVLVKISPRPRRPDRFAFANYFDINASDQGVVTFENLGRDALLVVPSPHSAANDYTELAMFLRNAPEPQVHALWTVLGRSIRQQLDDRPLWVSVAGGGIAWLHVRLDSYPKYYRYGPYRQKPG